MSNNEIGEKLVAELISNTKARPFGEGYNNVFAVNGGMESFYSSITSGLNKIAQDYINNPDTRVFINHNNDIEKWRYSVQVCGVDFWLDSFDTEQEALQFIEDNSLVMGE